MLPGFLRLAATGSSLLIVWMSRDPQVLHKLFLFFLQGRPYDFFLPVQVPSSGAA